jgi:fructose-specific component phosphotransferase system IIB-like protein
MPHSADSGWTIRTAAIPLLVSLALHGLLFLALWLWPARTCSPVLSIESTRITLDTCVLDPGSSTLLPERELPPDLLGQDVNTTLAPRLEETPPISSPKSAPAEPRASANGSHGPQADVCSSDGSLFPLPATAKSVVYVLDRSVSMGIDRKLDFARRELIASLRRLSPAVRFQIVDYNDSAETLVVDGQRDLLPAEPTIVAKAVWFLQALEAAGTTNHLAALRRGLDLHPDVLYLLTDADDLKPEMIAAITQRNQRTVIHTIELTRLRAPHPEGPLAQLARNNHGTYRRVALSD